MDCEVLGNFGLDDWCYKAPDFVVMQQSLSCSNKRTRCLENTVDFMKLKSFKATRNKLSETEHPLID
ncbi:unnamed protein product [Thlaspi arvense]|uniref:Uncharacterized protein n=1 Tax=Thlaspi arvense TaxID=13288 RepID=A0AAU9RTT4_THLAR|nr:unnamed protein product [Thlaspi arvense]